MLALIPTGNLQKNKSLRENVVIILFMVFPTQEVALDVTISTQKEVAPDVAKNTQKFALRVTRRTQEDALDAPKSTQKVPPRLRLWQTNIVARTCPVSMHTSNTQIKIESPLRRNKDATKCAETQRLAAIIRLNQPR